MWEKKKKKKFTSKLHVKQACGRDEREGHVTGEVEDDQRAAMNEPRDSASLGSCFTLAIIPPSPPAQPSLLCWLLLPLLLLLLLRRRPLYEPTCQPWGLPPDASSHSARGPPASWWTHKEKVKKKKKKKRLNNGKDLDHDGENLVSSSPQLVTAPAAGWESAVWVWYLHPLSVFEAARGAGWGSWLQQQPDMEHLGLWGIKVWSSLPASVLLNYCCLHLHHSNYITYLAVYYLVFYVCYNKKKLYEHMRSASFFCFCRGTWPGLWHLSVLGYCRNTTVHMRKAQFKSYTSPLAPTHCRSVLGQDTAGPSTWKRVFV